MRYEKLNDFYIQDNYTGQKLTLQKSIKRLNQYEQILQEIRQTETEIDKIIGAIIK